MKCNPIFQILFLIILLFCPCSHAGENEHQWKYTPKSIHWTGKIKGEIVEMDISEGDFLAAEHEVKPSDEHEPTIDGFEAIAASDASLEDKTVVHPHIKKWSITWGGKKVSLPKGIYTSVFLPGLSEPNQNFDAAHRKGDIWIGASDDGKELLVTMVCGRDGVSQLIAFTIAKDGQAHRFYLTCRS